MYAYICVFMCKYIYLANVPVVLSFSFLYIETYLYTYFSNMKIDLAKISVTWVGMMSKFPKPPHCGAERNKKTARPPASQEGAVHGLIYA